MKAWLAGETARVQTPRYVRDNIHVSLLAKAYVAFVGASPAPGTVRRLNPSGYPESQGAFTQRLRDEVALRLGRPCGLEFGTQTEFPEPAVRINTDLCDVAALGWSESDAWDAFVRYYQTAASA
jgi:UDP-glucose 4-epimerase